ncbi:hypothetical protein ACOMHN_021543 [Nucella lapillus]
MFARKRTRGNNIKTTQGRYSYPWIDTSVRRAIRRKQRAHTKARKTGKKRDQDRYKRLQQEVKDNIKKASHHYLDTVVTDDFKTNSKKLWAYVKSKGQESQGVSPLKNTQGYLKSDNCSKAEILNNQFKSVFTEEDLSHMLDKGDSPYQAMDDNSKKLWAYAKSKGQESQGVSPLKNTQGYLKSDNCSKAEILNNQFKSVFTEEDLSHMPDKGDSPYQAMDDLTVTDKDVQTLLRNLQPNKATGPDSIPAFILKSAADEITPILTKMFQHSLDIDINNLERVQRRAARYATNTYMEQAPGTVTTLLQDLR